ncbi:MAG: hypothetical protein R2706_16805 [Acidimicrobiales bacterium]
MPADVGAGTFWTEGTAAINGEQDAQAAADKIEASWPFQRFAVPNGFNYFGTTYRNMK